ncbi:MAG: restriction endonuclease subunit S [Dehalococcoidia bacterium]
MLRQIIFKDFVTLQRGFDLPTVQRVDGPYPVVASTTIHGYHTEYKVNPPGVTTGRSGALGEILYLQQPFWPLNTTLWVKDFKENFPRYVYYFLIAMHLERWDAGTGVPTLNRNHLDNVEIAVHDPNDQRKIAAILSAYDNLIENNTHRIKILEEMAQMIYREWFVNFRFPGHEKARMVESELRLIPDGWEVGTLNELVRIVSGFAFSSKEYVVNGKYAIVTIKNIQDGVFMSDCNSRVDSVPPSMPEHCRLHTGDILLSLTGNVGRTCLFYGEQHLLNQRVAKILPREGIGKSFVYFTFRQDSLRRRLEMISTGVAQQNLSPINLGNLELILPPKHLLTDFCRTFDVFVEHILLLLIHTANLRQTRDLLLPRLISGEIDVENLDIDTGETQA